MSIDNTKEAFVRRRAELLAIQFITEMGARFIEPNSDYGFDFIAFISSKVSSVFFGVTVKATERDITSTYPFSTRLLEHYLRSNVRVLIIVIDVKHNNIFFTWDADALSDVGGSVPRSKTWPLKLRHGEKEKAKLTGELLKLSVKPPPLV